MASNNTTVSGGMGRQWISEITKSDPVRSLVQTTGLSVKRDLENKARARGNTGFTWYYGSIVKRGPWGSTFVIWPTNAVSRSMKAINFSYLLTVGLRKNPRGWLR